MGKRNGAGNGKKRATHAHVQGVDGEALCGARPTTLVPCPDCLAWLRKQVQVHIASPRKPGKTMCGGELEGARAITPELARELASLPASERPDPFLCDGCAFNLDLMDGNVSIDRDPTDPTAGETYEPEPIGDAGDAIRATYDPEPWAGD